LNSSVLSAPSFFSPPADLAVDSAWLASIALVRPAAGVAGWQSHGLNLLLELLDLLSLRNCVFEFLKFG
jgi:hypothetical protein